MTASARSNDSGHGDNNHHGDRNKFKQNKFGSRRPDRSLYVPKGVRQSQVPGTSGDKEQQYDKEMQDQVNRSIIYVLFPLTSMVKQHKPNNKT